MILNTCFPQYHTFSSILSVFFQLILVLVIFKVSWIMWQRFSANSAPLSNLIDENIDNKKHVLDSEDLEKNQNLTLLKVFHTSHHKK